MEGINWNKPNEKKIKEGREHIMRIIDSIKEYTKTPILFNDLKEGESGRAGRGRWGTIMVAYRELERIFSGTDVAKELKRLEDSIPYEFFETSKDISFDDLSDAEKTLKFASLFKVLGVAVGIVEEDIKKYE